MMAELGEIRRKARIAGIRPDRDVIIEDKLALGSGRLKVFYKDDDGYRGSTILTNTDESRICIISPGELRRAAKSRSPEAYSLRDYITSGLIVPPLPLEASYTDGRGGTHTLHACVEHDGGIAVNFEVHDSLRHATDAAVAHVHEAGNLGPRSETPDVWNFWRFHDESGTRRVEAN